MLEEIFGGAQSWSSKNLLLRIVLGFFGGETCCSYPTIDQPKRKEKGECLLVPKSEIFDSGNWKFHEESEMSEGYVQTCRAFKKNSSNGIRTSTGMCVCSSTSSMSMSAHPLSLAYHISAITPNHSPGGSCQIRRCFPPTPSARLETWPRATQSNGGHVQKVFEKVSFLLPNSLRPRETRLKDSNLSTQVNAGCPDLVAEQSFPLIQSAFQLFVETLKVASSKCCCSML